MPSDINLKALVFRKIPEKWHPFIKLARLDRPTGIWLLLLPCWWGIVLASGGIVQMSAQSWTNAILFAMGAVLMRAAGCIVNDLWDQKLDASVERTKSRPLASGEISVSHAIRFLAILLAASLLILISMPRVTIILGVLSLALVAAYPYMKRLTWWPQLFLGFTFNWGVLMGGASVYNELSWAIVLAYMAGIFWTLGYDTIYAHQDKEDDVLIGIKSTALLFGDKSQGYVAVFYGLSLLFLLIAKYMILPSLLTPLLTAVAAAQIIWQIRVWDMNDPESCLRVFKSNQVYGWLVLLMLAI